jgi:glycosyltransferase involved in cell wall biosynthesis
MIDQIPSISVILPTYNQAGYLNAALDSILNQTCSDYELIIVDDGSTDDTPRLLEQFHQPPLCTVIRQTNQSLPVALNTGFRLARGKYLTWTSSDNILHPNMLTELQLELEANPEVGLVYADWQLIDGDGNILREVQTPEFDRFLLMRINYINACFMYRRAFQEKYGLYNPEYLHAEDWEYWWRMAQVYKMRRVPQVLYQYRTHAEGLTTSSVRTQKKGKSQGYLRLEGDFRARKIDWLISKIKWELLRLRLGQDPKAYYQP